MQKAVLKKEDEWLPSQQQIRELRGVIRAALADYGFLLPFSLNEHKTGPWEFPVSKERRFYKPSEEQKKLCISFQLKPDNIEVGLDHLLEQIKSIKELETARLVIRDPGDAFFRQEPFILECYLDESQATAIGKQLAEAVPESILSEESLFCEQEYKKGIISFARAEGDNVLPSVYENLHNQVIKPVRETLSGAQTISAETVLQNQLFLTGRNRHDPLTRRIYIIRPQS